jgi:hypothetical protein
MRTTDRDYCVSTIAVLQDQLRMIQVVASDMAMRLDELDETLLYAYAQKEDEELDELMSDSWESGYAYSTHLAQKDAESEPTSPKLCMCDECWDVSDDEGCDCKDCREYTAHRNVENYGNRMSVGNIMDILTKTRKPNDTSH